jgi:predicted transcriptional regulator of viral defense system
MFEIKKTASWSILNQLAAQNRRILSDWRAVILLRRATDLIPPKERRWTSAPTSTTDLYPTLSNMERRGEIRRLQDLRGIYEITVPYARSGLIQEDEILMEVHPYAALSHRSALVFHGLTNDLPKDITAIMPASSRVGLLPPGTEPLDWEAFAIVPGRVVPTILDRPVHWMRVAPARYFGLREYAPQGYPVRVTTPERTLLDALQRPDLSGGIENVFRAWARARDLLDLDGLIADVDRLEIALLRQRAGYILEELGLSHPALESWRQTARRGGSNKLVGTEPYSSTYSERWSLSLNAPVAALHEGGEHPAEIDGRR